MNELTKLPGDFNSQIPLDENQEPFQLPDTDESLLGKLNLPDQDSILIQNYDEASRYNPERMAKVKRYAEELRESPAFIDKNLEDAERFVAAPDSTFWNDYEKRFPKSAKFLAQQKNMFMASDDYENLSKTEKAIDDSNFFMDVYNSAQSGLATLYSNTSRIPALAYSLAAYPQNQIAKAVGRPDLQVTPPEMLINNPVAKFYDEQSEAYIPKIATESVSQKFLDGDYTGGARTLVANIALNAPQQIMNIALGLSGAGVGASMLATGSIQSANSLKENLDKGYDPAASTLNSVYQGSFESLVENMSFGTTGSIRILKDLGKRLTGEIGEVAAKKAMVEVAKQITHSMASEGFEELVTQAAQDFSSYATVDPKALEGIGGRMADAFIIGAGSGGSMTATGALYQRQVNTMKARRLSAAYSEIGKIANESKLKSRDPEAHAEVINDMVGGTNIENVYIGAEEFRTYFQSKGIDPDVMGKELGIENEVQEATETGGQIKIPMGKWTSKLSGTEHFEGLKNDITFSQEDYSSNQNAKLSEELKSQLLAQDQVAQAQIEEDNSIAQQADEVYTAIRTDLINRGQDGKVADASATLWKNIAVATSARQGITVREWFENNRPTIVNGNDKASAGYQRKQIPSFESSEVVDSAQVKKALADLGFPEVYQSDESISAIRQTIALMQNEISQAEAGRRAFREGEVGGDQIVESIPSTFPAWFRENFKTKKDFLKVSSKGNSKNLNPLIQQVVKALKEGQGDSAQNAIAPNLDFVSLVDPDSLDSAFEVSQAMNQGKTEFFQSKERRDAGLQVKQSTVELPGVIDVTKITTPLAINLKEDLSKFTNNYLADRAITNKHTGNQIKITENTRGKVLSELNGRKSKLASQTKDIIRVISEIDKIIESAVFYEEAVKDEKNKGRDFAYYFSNAKINGFDTVVQLQVDRKNNNELYNIKVVNLGVENRERGVTSADKASNPGAPDSPTALPLSSVSLSDFEAKINRATENKYFQDVKDIKRGSVEFRNGQRIVRLFAEADQSTFLHESAHIFFQDFYNHAMSGDASERFLKDWSKLADWLGYNPEQTELTVEQHEKFARGFERYLMEGDAPTKGLRRVFGQFRKWLTRIYKSVRALDSEITPDVREIMARMVATENEIALAKKEAGIESDIDVSDMPEAVKSKLNDIRFEAEERAFAALMKDQMKEISTDHREFLAEKRKEITKKVREEVRQSDAGQQIQAIKDAIKSKDIWETSTKFIKGELSEERKIQFDMAAEGLGYTSGDHMAQEIQDMPTIDTMVKSQVEEAMKEFESLTDKEIIREKAREAIHGDKSTELLALEKEIFRKKILEETESENQKIADAMEKDQDDLIRRWIESKAIRKTEVKFEKKIDRMAERHTKEINRLTEREKERKIREDQKRLASEWLAAKDAQERKSKAAKFRESIKELNKAITSYSKNEADLVKAQAREMLSKKSHSDAGRFVQYFTAERNAALRVAKAIANNDWDKALTAKHEQMLNHALAKESMSIKKRSTKYLKFLNEVRTSSRQSFKNEDHWYQASKMLERFGIVRADFDPDFQGDTLEQWVQKYDETIGITNIPGWLLTETTRIKTGELTIEQLEDVRNAISNIKQVANFEDKLFALEGKITMSELAGNLVAESKKNFDPGKRFKNKFVDTKIDKLKGWMRQYMFSLKKIETILGPLDNWEENGLWTRTFKDSVYEAANNESKMIHEARKSLESVWATYTDQERKDIYNKDIYIDELKISLKKESLLAMALNLGNDGNRDRLFGTRPVGIDSSLPWGEGIVLQILQRELTAKDWKFVQANWNLLESFWPKIKKLHKEMTGFSPGKVENKKFSVYVQGGEKVDLDGGYYPLKEDSRGSLAAEIREGSDTALYNEQNPAWKASTKTGHTKERSNTQYPVALSLGLVNRHLMDVIHDLNFRPIVTDLRRLTSLKEMQLEMRQTLTPEGHKEINSYVQNIAGAAGGEPLNAIEKAVKIVRHKTSNAVLMYKVSVITQNFANAIIFPNAVEGFTYKDAFKSYFKYGMGDYAIKLLTNNADTTRDFVYEKSAFMRDRAESPDYTIEEVHNKFSKDEASAVSKFGGGLMAWTDEFTNIPMWMGAYNKSIADGKSEKEAVRYADTLIERVAGSSRKYDVSSIVRGNEIQKIFTMFFSWLNTEHNRWMREVGIFQRDKDIPRALGFLAGRMIFQIAGAALMFKLPDPDEEEEVLKFAVANTVGYPLSFFPILRDVTTVISDQALGAKSFGYNPSPALASAETLLNFTDSAIDLAKGNEEAQNTVEKGAKLASLGFGYPDQFNQWFFNMYDYTSGMEPQVKDIYRRRPKKER